jgi:hypothetical protein
MRRILDPTTDDVCGVVGQSGNAGSAGLESFGVPNELGYRRPRSAAEIPVPVVGTQFMSACDPKRRCESTARELKTPKLRRAPTQPRICCYLSTISKGIALTRTLTRFPEARKEFFCKDFRTHA